MLENLTVLDKNKIAVLSIDHLSAISLSELIRNCKYYRALHKVRITTDSMHGMTITIPKIKNRVHVYRKLPDLQNIIKHLLEITRLEESGDTDIEFRTDYPLYNGLPDMTKVSEDVATAGDSL